MSTRQERIDASKKHMEQVKKDHPEIPDLDAFSARMEKHINLEFDIKDTIGEDGWKKMNAVLENRLNKTSEPNAQATLAELRGYLDGHKDLQDRFDAMFNHINDGTMATVKNWSAKPEA